MVIRDDRVFTISTQNGKLLEVGELSCEDGGVIRIWSPTDGDAQKWKLMEAGDGYYRIVNVLSGKALDIAMQGGENGTPVHQWEITDSDSQLWVIASIGHGYYKIMSKSCGKCLDRVAMGTEEGTPAQIWEDNGGASQKWKVAELAGVKERSPATKPLVARESGKKAKAATEKTSKKRAARVKA